MSRRGLVSRRFASSLSPIIIGTPTLWTKLDAAFVTKDGSNNISAIAGQGSLGGTLSEGTVAREPLWVNNGNPAGTYPVMNQTPDGANLKRIRNLAVSGDAFSTATGYTIFLVTKITLSGGGSTDPVWYYNNGSVRGGWQCEVVSNLRQCQARTSGGTVKAATFGTYTTNTWEIWCVRNWGGGSNDVDSTTWFKARVNGAAVAVAGTPWFWVPTTPNEGFGSSTATAGPVRIVAEAIAYADYMSDAECRSVEGGLGTKHGITLA